MELPAIAHNVPLHRTHINIPYNPYPTQFAHHPSYTFPPGVDPASVDARAFYSYIPNEVRHRKRTSRAQLKVLEDTFRTDQKPNPALRKCLAQQLDMLPRAVQVWFQNRRAKDKTLAKKALIAQHGPAAGSGSEHALPSPASDCQSMPPSTPVESRDSPAASPVDCSDDSDDAPSKLAFHGTAPTPPGPQPDNTPAEGPAVDAIQLSNSRRCSLPTSSLLQDPARLPVERMHSHSPNRRKSLETNLQRLSSHPYAPVVAASTGTVLGGSGSLRIQQSTAPSSYKRGALRLLTDLPTRSSLLIRANSNGYAIPRPVDSVGQTQPAAASITPPALLPTAAPSPYMFPPKLPAAPVIPGPLPAPDFSFGAATVAYRDQESDGESRSMRDNEDDSPTGAYSRFGSFASVADSDVTSASTMLSEYSVDPPAFPRGWAADTRRASCPDQFVKMLSGLEVAAPGTRSFMGDGRNFSTSMRFNGHGMGLDSFQFPVDKQEACVPRTRSELEFALQSALPEGHVKQEETKAQQVPLRKYAVNAPESSSLQDALGVSNVGLNGQHMSGAAVTNYAPHMSSAASSVSSLGLSTPLDLPAFAPSGVVDQTVNGSSLANEPYFPMGVQGHSRVASVPCFPTSFGSANTFDFPGSFGFYS